MTSEIAAPVVDRILTGHYLRGEEYFCWRSSGIVEWSLIYTLGGVGHFGGFEGEMPALEGHAVLIPPRVAHDYRTAPGSRWEILWAVFDPPQQWSPLLCWPRERCGLFRLKFGLPIRAAVAERLAAMHRLALHPSPLAGDLALNALEGALLLANTVNPLLAQGAEVDPAVTQVMEYVAQNLTRPLPLAELARVSGQSIARMCYMFKRHLQLSPQVYVEKQRIARACHLLHRTTLSVKKIADELAFSSPFYFARRFKKHLGKSPTAYRESVWRSEEIITR